MRSRPAHRRRYFPDPIYPHVLVTRLVNGIIRDGKKTVARGQVYRGLEQVKTQAGGDPLRVFLTAVENVRPQMEVRPRRIGGAAYQVPTPVRTERRDILAIKWLVEAARSRPNTQYHTFSEKLAAEIIDAANNTGGAIKKKQDTQRMAEANKAFAHFRW